jgi:GntR family transcriptional regulator/GntR family frlABCD operon transcriptional regulator
MRKVLNIPVHKKLSDDIKKQIDDGQYKNGDLLPSENELSIAYNTSRTTVRLALIELSNIGYIRRHQGKGSIGVTAGVGSLSLQTVILEKPTKQPWPPNLFYKLSDKEISFGCIHFSRLRYIDNVPILYEQTFITDLNLPRFTSRNLENVSFLKLLSEQYQVEVTGGEQKIWAIAAGKKIGELLKLKALSPIVHLKRKLRTNVTDLNIYSWLYCNTENYYLDDYF